jgi:ubiquinone/menaquinone biosynthesis C-methylase UbiE
MQPSDVFEEIRPGDYLMRIAASGIGRAYKDLARSELAIRRGDVVVDLGCGPGADLGDFADAVGSGGRVIGLDSDPAALALARDRVAKLPAVEVVECDIHATGLRDAQADRVHTDRVLQHVADPAAALREARRILRLGGRAVFAEPDWDTLIIDHPDLSIARAYSRFVSERVVRNACVGRQLARLASGAGFEVTGVTPITAVYSDVQEADKVLGLQRVTQRAVAAGYLAEEPADEFLSHLAEQPFFASTTLFVVTATAR